MTEEIKKEEQVEEIASVETNEEVVEETQAELTVEEQQEKKIKNLISVAILLAGLFVGSLFVDIAQMFRGGGFSQRVLSKTDVFQVDGKTWVAYSEPLVKVQVVTDETCEACKPDEALVGLRRVMPTMLTEKVDASSEEGKALLAKFNIKTIPALIFSKEVEKTELFAQAGQFFEAKDGAYALKTADVGLPVGKYVEGPNVSEKDIQLGAKDAEVKLVLFGNFQNPADKQFFQTVAKQALQDYGDKIQFVFKNYLPPTATQATSAALAAACANEQGKFMEYADKLYTAQTTWSKVKDATPIFKGYAATLKLNVGDFNKCLDEKRYKDLISASVAEGQSFALVNTPSVFVNNDLQKSLKYDDVKKILDAQLAK